MHSCRGVTKRLVYEAKQGLGRPHGGTMARDHGLARRGRGRSAFVLHKLRLLHLFCQPVGEFVHVQAVKNPATLCEACTPPTLARPAHPLLPLKLPLDRSPGNTSTSSLPALGPETASVACLPALASIFHPSPTTTPPPTNNNNNNNNNTLTSKCADAEEVAHFRSATLIH